MIEYNAYIEVEAPEGADVYTAQAVDEALEKTEIEGPATGYDSKAKTISVRYNVNAKGPEDAVEIGLKYLFETLEYTQRLGHNKLVALEAEPFVDPAEKDLVSQSEIARRLGISTTRVGQLAAMPGFPKGVREVDTSRTLYRWGDVLAWRLEREATAKPGRPERAKSEKAVAA